MKEEEAKDELVIDVLMKEYERVCSDIRAIEIAVDRIVAIGITIVGAGFAYGLQHNINEVFFFLPVGLIGIFLLASHQQYKMYWFGGYKRAIEDYVNKQFGILLLNWEKVVQIKRHRIDIINGSLNAVYLASLIGCSYFSMYRIFIKYGAEIGYWYSFVIIILTIVLLISTRLVFSAHDISYRINSELIGTKHCTEKG